MIEAVLLDVDGTLIDSNDQHARAWLDALTEAGFTASFGAVRGRIGMGGDHLIPALVGVPEDAAVGRDLSARRARLFKERYRDTIRAFPGARELLERVIAAGIKPVVATSSNADDLTHLLDLTGLADLLDLRTTGDDAERSKPDPDIVTSALKLSGASAHRALMIGDTPYDLAAAAGAGVPALGFLSGGWPAEKLVPSLAVYDGPAHLLAEFDRSPLRRDRSLG